MYRRLLTIVVLSLAVSACVPYYSGYSGYRATEVYTSPAPYYYGGYRSYYVYPRGYYAPSPRYWGPGYRPSPGYHNGYGGGYGGGYGSGQGRGWGGR
ncbi:hypothetical protein [Pseudomonas sp. CCC3.1]|uniref:hypothetical protein n=1 Tax=Pseudomonas sp. CCC3.1 TaxID=3048607 RepID=UPI002AC94DB4|nr:hypothetical protein [Pseudomonas sp. CCC3.1]MEB0206211.1 hypothetical protein [Pseudomonas sp. CCC3.1]WPX34969.1 hypothetical protein RHM56_16925 [Pseudomonas sp. CCC3.1]